MKNGAIVYKPIFEYNDIREFKINTEATIITQRKQRDIKILAFSDLHFGNKKERLDLLDRAYNYCIKKGINIIFCCGDMIDGSVGKDIGEKNIENIYEQIEYFIKNYPFDKNILTFGVGGNHDISALCQGNQDFIEIIKNYRHDVIIPAYHKSYINIKNDKILLHHKINYESSDFIEKDIPLVLKGHRHKYLTKMTEKNNLNVCIPSLSDIDVNNNHSLPTAVELNLNFDKGYIHFVNLKQIYFGTDDFILSEVEYDLLKDRDIDVKNIKNEENMKKKLKKK